VLLLFILSIPSEMQTSERLELMATQLNFN